MKIFFIMNIPSTVVDKVYPLLQNLLICPSRENHAFLHWVFFLSFGLLFMDLKSSPFLMALVVMLHDHATHSQDGLHPPWIEGQPKRGNSNTSWVKKVRLSG